MQSKRNYRRYREIADKIAQRIVAGDYVAGDRLPSERDLVEQLGVSRPTLREALIALEIMGYVKVRGGSGIYVVGSQPTQPEIDLGVGTFELLEASKIIEADVAGIAAKNISGEQLVTLHSFIEHRVKGYEQDSGLFDAADREFHTLIAKATGNSALHFVVEELWKFRRESDIWLMLDERFDIQPLKARAIDDHIKIHAALEAHDADGAFHAMSAHIQYNIDWRLGEVPAVSDTDRRTQVRLRLERERKGLASVV